jgi:hypothetical protein
MRRSDIEVPNLPVDVASALIVQRRLYLHLFRDAWRVMNAIDLHRIDAARPSLARRREVVTGRPRIACSLFASAARSIAAAASPLPSVLPRPAGFHRYEPRVYRAIARAGSPN